MYEISDKSVWIAKDCLESVVKELGQKFDSSKILKTKCGTHFCGEPYKGQFDNRSRWIVFSEHVTTNTGTGFVHIAPAHGIDDFKIGKSSKLFIESVIDDNGKTNYPIEELNNLPFKKANGAIIDYLYEKNLLLKSGMIKHKYPFSNRSNNPVITKTTEQWFINLDKPYNDGPTLRQRSLAALDEVDWIPEHGYNRIKGMLETRPDWCLSRQRTWGVPIPYHECNKCNYINLNSDWINKLANEIEPDEFKLDLWFNKTNNITCPKCETVESYAKKYDILDVWFDSGVSSAAVMDGKQVDLYLEGSDQHRGWFQSSLLSALGARESIPYKAVLTHGFVVDEKGEKLSKSRGNYTDPFKFIDQNGAEVLRLWAASADFKNDIKFSEDVLSGVKQTAHKIRNTIRYMVAATDDFDPNEDHTLHGLEKYIVQRWTDVFNICMKAYEDYDFHTVVKTIEKFCILELSSFYFEVIKDDLYCGLEDGKRRFIQAALYKIVNEMIQLISPIMSFTAYEAWKELKKDNSSNVFLSILPKRRFYAVGDLTNSIDVAREIREIIYSELEKLRKKKEVGSFIEANVNLTLPKELLHIRKINLAELFCVSNVMVEEGSDFNIEVEKAKQSQCQRCWRYLEEVGSMSIKDICARCDMVLKEFKE